MCLCSLSSVLCLWTTVEGWSYFYSNTTMNWNDARAWCREHYTDMVAIQNQKEIEHLNSWLPRIQGYYWIGIRKVNNVWTWVGTNKTLTAEATNWAKGEPNNGKNGQSSGDSEDCVEMYIKRDLQPGKWNDERCAKSKTALCYTGKQILLCLCRTFYFENEKLRENITICYIHAIWKYFLFPQLPVRATRAATETAWRPSTATGVLVLKASPERRASRVRKYCSRVDWACFKFTLLSITSSQDLMSNSVSFPLLTVVECDKDQITVPSKGSVECTHQYGNFSYNSSCQYSCEEGYRLSMSRPLTCTASTEWSDQPPTCECELKCKNPRITTLYHHNEGACFNVICLIFSSTVVQCPALSRPERGSMMCSDPLGPSSYQSTCVFSCEEGYVLRGSPSNTLQCQASGTWNSPQPFCVGMPTFVFFYLAVFHSINSLIMREYLWFFKKSNVDLFCSSLCFAAVQCPAIQEPENGIASCGENADVRFSYGNTCSFSCVPGYRLSGPSSVTCTSEAKWSETDMPRCEGKGTLWEYSSRPLYD